MGPWQSLGRKWAEFMDVFAPLLVFCEPCGAWQLTEPCQRPGCVQRECAKCGRCPHCGLPKRRWPGVQFLRWLRRHEPRHRQQVPAGYCGICLDITPVIRCEDCGGDACGQCGICGICGP